MDTRGGEAKKITSLKGDLDEYVWSPDGKRIAMTIKDEIFLIRPEQRPNYQ
jgi:Tol biopolymer transport system component